MQAKWARREGCLAPWLIRGNEFVWGQRTYLMGILNVTPDSFSDGGKFASVETAVDQALRLTAAGADILDIGGQSTRPQAEDVSLETELARVIPAVKAIRQVCNIPISVDTTKAAVAAAAIAAGADIVNDISGATYDPEMLPVVAELGVPIILMHMRGTPQTMQQMTHYNNLVEDIIAALHTRVIAAQAAGVPLGHIAIDPGLGFAKAGFQNVELLRQLSKFQSLGCPILTGPSRKSFIGQILNRPDPQDRVWGTAAACCAAITAGTDILRVHDVAQIYDVSRVADVIWRNPPA